tara:strand:- start:2097 stop:2375 length:279 start_codon:yes stop_codon:yes gene_type:complete
MFDTNLRIDVIATYNHIEQDFFNCGIWERALKNEKTLISYIKKQLRHKKDLVKISLCFICSKEIVEKYPTVKKIINERNGKFYFNNWKRKEK